MPARAGQPLSCGFLVLVWCTLSSSSGDDLRPDILGVAASVFWRFWASAAHHQWEQAWWRTVSPSLWRRPGPRRRRFQRPPGPLKRRAVLHVVLEQVPVDTEPPQPRAGHPAKVCLKEKGKLSLSSGTGTSEPMGAPDAGTSRPDAASADWHAVFCLCQNCRASKTKPLVDEGHGPL